MDERPQSLEDVEATLWREMITAARYRDHPWRTATLATTDGTSADARLVVLRDVDEVQRHITFYSDSRAGKLAHISAHPAATLVMWSPSLGWQLRARVTLSVETGGLAVASRWAQLKLSPAAYDYLSPLPPGMPIEGTAPRTIQPDRESLGHFAVVTAAVDALDWLELGAEGQRRAQFDSSGRRWLQP